MHPFPPSPATPLSERAERLRALLRAAGDACSAWFGRDAHARRKEDDSLVTAADLAAEAAIVAGLAAWYPEDGLLSEESPPREGHSGAWWVVDPLDGTHAFTEGLAHWGPTVARVWREGPAPRLDLGATWLPRLGEHYHVEGGAAWFNGAPLPTLGPPRGVIYVPSGFPRFFRLDYRCKARNLGGTAAHLALVARGAAGAVIVGPGWRLWDTVVGVGLIEAVGGRAVRLPDQRPIDLFRDEGVPFVAGSPETVDELARPGRIVPVPMERS